jgi:putative mycofactocin binding protein MftB
VSLSTIRVFDASAQWRVSPQVSLRDESFGALAYNHDTRRLVFLKSTQLVALIRQLDGYESVNDALDALIPTGQRERYVKALASLVTSEILCGR